MPEIFIALHQTESFCIKTQLNHEQAIKRLGRYLLHTRKEGIFFSPEKPKGLECYVYAKFVGGWQQADANDADNVM